MYKFVNVLSPEIMSSVFNLKEKNRYSLINVYELYSLVFNAKNMVYSTSYHKRKHFFIFFQNKNKEMATRFPMSALQKIFATCWFCIESNFVSLVNRPCEEACSEPSQTSEMEVSACIDNGMSSWIILIRSCT